MTLRLFFAALIGLASVTSAQPVAQPVAPPSPAAPAASSTETDIVVVARRRSCDVSIADRLISTREFNERAAEWANGTMVRVHVPTHSDLQCLSKIAFRLGKRGVRRMVFIEPGQ